MTIPPNPSELFSPFLASTYNIPETDERLDTYLVDNLTQFADTINDKKIGGYTQNANEFNGEKWIYDTPKRIRTGYQSIARIPQYPNAGILTLTLTSNPAFPIQGINQQFIITSLYGTASKPCSQYGANDGDYFSFMNQGDSRISFTMSDQQIIITTTTDLRSYNGFIVIHFLRDGD